MVTARSRPSAVMVSFHKETTDVPGVRNKLKTTVINSSIRMLRIPRTINLKGTVDSLITSAKNNAEITYPR